MKDIVTILREQGFEIPEEKEADIRKSLSGNYITTAEAEKKAAKLESERDQFKEQAQTISDKLKELEGIDHEGLKKQLDEANSKIKQIEADYQQKQRQKELEDTLDGKLSGLKFSSKAARENVRTKLLAKELKVENGVLIGFDDYINELKTSDADAFASDTPPAKFTAAAQGGTGDGMTKDKILAVRDTVERRKLIERHIELFQ